MSRCAIFDLDGTLLNSLTVICRIVDEMLAERGSLRRLCEAEARPYASLGGRAMIAALLGDEASDPDTDVADFRARYASRPTPVESVYSGVRQGLKQLSARDFALGLCSNKPQQLCEKVLEDVGLRSFFQSIVGARDGLPLKPDPALLALVTSELGASPGRCVYVGDSDLDHAIASAMATPCVLVTYGYGDLQHIDPSVPRADSFLDAVDQIVAISRLGDKQSGVNLGVAA